jgi:hypothetical protein
LRLYGVRRGMVLLGPILGNTYEIWLRDNI